MSHTIIKENQLDEWVRGNSRDAQGVIVELVYRLVAASSPNPLERRFPLGDSIGQPGPDGVLHTDSGLDPFVPEGRSYWEIGTGTGAGDKATSDYRGLTETTPENIRQESAFVFVTPLSGRRDWQYTWKEDQQASWLKERRESHIWRDVQVIDGSGLIDWMAQFPSVELWLRDKMGLPTNQLRTAEQHWGSLRTIGDPPPLTPDIFLANRDAASIKLEKLLAQTTQQLKLDTHYPEQAADFVAAHIASLTEEIRTDINSRCLFVSGNDGWNIASLLREPHILVADFDMSGTDPATVRLMQQALRARHAVIYGGPPGGIPHPNRAAIPNPKAYQVKTALEKAGYHEERARVLSQKSDGNLGALLRCLQNLSIMPEWAQETEAAHLAVAQLLGGWDENSEADRTVVEQVSGNAYREWIGEVREIALRPDTPAVSSNGNWRITPRYEAWYTLGPRLFDDHLKRFGVSAINVLGERDSQFDLEPEERYTASIHGKGLSNSHVLRNGLAETLALLGSHPSALTSCSMGQAETTAALVVRDVLAKADWEIWASLNDVLPFLAEASPREFLNAIEGALAITPSPFDAIFSQERAGMTDRTYMSGLLWALETLAWDADYLVRVTVILGELAAKDPGGNWGNRPHSTLSTIFLPWLPQTCAPISKRIVAITALLEEQSEVAWQLLLSILPTSNQSSTFTRKPMWRMTIPGDWKEGVTQRDYWEQVNACTDLAINIAEKDIAKLGNLIERMDDLIPPARHRILTRLGSEEILAIPLADRVTLWTELTDLALRHKKFADAEWAMSPETVEEISQVANRLMPDTAFYRSQRLFSERDFDLYEEKGNYQEQQARLEENRRKAVEEIYSEGGLTYLLEFTKVIETPWRVGIAFAHIAKQEDEEKIIPVLLESDNKKLAQFAGGFVWEGYRTRGWEWVDTVLEESEWPPSQIAQILAYLPFSPDAWERARILLGDDEGQYWAKSRVNPYDAETHEIAIDKLVEYGRANEALILLERYAFDKRQLNTRQTVKTLLASIKSLGDGRAINGHAIAEIISSLQENDDLSPEDSFAIEWAFLPLLGPFSGASPKFLQKKLAQDPSFFCELIRLVFRSKTEAGTDEPASEERKNIASNAYRLLSEWKTPPGKNEDNSFDGNAFSEWLKQVKATCGESGHLEVGLTMVGHALAYAPRDPDGLWLHHAVAKELNAKDVNDMRNGFRIELFNSRGVHSWTSGEEELALSVHYMAQAEELETHGYHRLATSMREMAESYRLDAEREASRDIFDI